MKQTMYKHVKVSHNRQSSSEKVTLSVFPEFSFAGAVSADIIGAINSGSSSKAQVRNYVDNDENTGQFPSLNARVTGGVFTMPSQTELAMREFLREARSIPGVSVEAHWGRSVSIDVWIPDYFSEQAKSIFLLEANIWRNYPEANFDISVRSMPPATSHAR
jgi:hypothetical protein